MYKEQPEYKDEIRSSQVSKPTAPDFEQILDELRKESMNIEVNSDRLYELTNRVKPINPEQKPNTDSSITKSERSGNIVAYLWYEIERIGLANARLKNTLNHLQCIVGNE